MLSFWSEGRDNGGCPGQTLHRPPAAASARTPAPSPRHSSPSPAAAGGGGSPAASTPGTPTPTTTPTTPAHAPPPGEQRRRTSRATRFPTTAATGPRTSGTTTRFPAAPPAPGTATAPADRPGADPRRCHRTNAAPFGILSSIPTFRYKKTVIDSPGLWSPIRGAVARSSGSDGATHRNGHPMKLRHLALAAVLLGAVGLPSPAWPARRWPLPRGRPRWRQTSLPRPGRGRAGLRAERVRVHAEHAAEPDPGHRQRHRHPADLQPVRHPALRAAVRAGHLRQRRRSADLPGGLLHRGGRAGAGAGRCHHQRHHRRLQPVLRR